ncbi:MAG: DMT family transporter, partial [Anaerolineae bacterium]
RLANVAPTTAAFFRTAYAVPVLIVIWLATRSRDARSPAARWMAFLSGILLAVDLVLWHHSIAWLGAGLATVVANIQVVFVGGAAWILYRERPARLTFLIVPLAFLGVALISGLGRVEAYGARPAAGTIAAVLAGATYAGFLLLFRASNRGLAPPHGPLLDATLGAAAASLAIGVLDPSFQLAPVWPAHGWLLGLAVAVQIGGWLLIATALPRLPALETSVLLLLQPMLTVVWAVLIFSELLSAIQWLGVALVLSGIAALSLRGSVQRPAAAPAKP